MKCIFDPWAWVRKIPWRRAWQPLQYSCLENPGTGEPGRLPSMGSHRVRHDWGDLAAAVDIVGFFFSPNWRFVATLPGASLLVPFFLTVFAQFMSLWHIVVILTILQTFLWLVCLWWWSVISDLWCHYLKKIMTPWRFNWWLAFLAMEYFKVKVYTYFKDIMLLHT